MRSAPPPSSTGLGFAVERHPVPADAVRANGMISATNLIVRERFGPGPVIALNAHGDVVPPGLGWSSDPYGAVDPGRLHVRPRRRRVEIGHRHLQLRAARAEGERRAARGHGRAALHLRRGGRRRHRPGLDPRARPVAARFRAFRRLLLRHHHRAQRLPAPRSRHRRPIGACGAARTPASTRSRRPRACSRTSMRSAAPTPRPDRTSRGSARPRSPWA